MHKCTECKHTEVKYCEHCQRVYCCRCSKEWGSTTITVDYDACNADTVGNDSRDVTFADVPCSHTN